MLDALTRLDPCRLMPYVDAHPQLLTRL